MDEPVLNPYAPSAVAETSFPEEEGGVLWRIDFNELWVRDGAVFEGIDLGTGEAPPPDPVRRKVLLAIVPKVPWLRLAAGLMPLVVGGVVYGVLRTSGLGAWWVSPVLVVLAIVAPLFPLPWNRRVRIYYEESRSRRRWRRGMFLALGVMMGGLAIWCARVFMAVQDVLVSPGKALGFSPVPMYGVSALVLIFSLVIARFNKVPRKRSQAGEWFLLKGVAPAAMEHLRRTAGGRV